MGQKQAGRQADKEREDFDRAVMTPGFVPKYKSWYADNFRESIRDETLREGLVEMGAVVVRSGVPTTSGRGRYALKTDFADLFDPGCEGENLDSRIEAWRKKHLSPEARARLQIVHHGRTLSQHAVTVTLPNRESRNMQTGISSEIAKQVIEVFAPRFLADPAVIWISESGNKVIQRDDKLARAIGLEIRPERALPDIILADVTQPLLLVFVEVVATDGAIVPSRRKALLELAAESRIEPRHVLFVTAFLDRDQSAFRKAISNLAWGTFAWIASEPHSIIALDGASPQGITKLRDFVNP
jgi:hypothetical protein